MPISLEHVAAEPYTPPWNSVSRLELQREQSPQNEGLAKLYPNVKGCGYPPDLDCDAFFEEFGKVGYLNYMTSTQVKIRREVA